jgi:hypothetical protein
MIYGLFGLVLAILAVIVIAIRRDLAQLDAQARRVAIAAPELTLESEPDPADSFEDDRVVTGQLLPITEQHCRASGGRGKRKDWKKKPKSKRREDWKSGKEVI